VCVDLRLRSSPQASELFQISIWQFGNCSFSCSFDALVPEKIITQEVLRNFEPPSCMMDTTLTRELIVAENKFLQLDTISEWTRNLTCQKKYLEVLDPQVVWWVIHCTFKFVVLEIQILQLDTIPKWIRNLTCQKKYLEVLNPQVVWWVLHLPLSWLSLSRRLLSSTQFPSVFGVWPVKKST
jgi:hypothetical protein